MNNNTITTARKEIQEVLRRYRLNWEDVAPDRDGQIWKNIAASARRIRKQLFSETYLNFSAKTKKN